jgi:hypothetical protein
VRNADRTKSSKIRIKLCGQPQKALPPPFLVAQGANPNLSAFCSAAIESSAVSHDPDPSERRASRLLARLGLLEDAPPLFRVPEFFWPRPSGLPVAAVAAWLATRPDRKLEEH